MSRRKWFILGAVGIALCVCVIPLIAVAIYFFRPALFNPLLPVYDYKVVSSSHTGYSHQTLILGGTTYESDYAEYALSSPGSDHQIGQTASGMRLYEVYGQKNYVVLYDFMDQVAVFRNSQQPALDLKTAGITGMKLASLAYAPGMGPEKDTSDPQLIKYVITTLTDDTPVAASSSGSNIQKYCLYLSGGSLYGMQYCAGVYVDQAGQVYLARDSLTKDWFQADPLFSAWVKTP